ncbi:MAG TPA: acyl-CoA thioesterase II [Rhizomicrobium sp.]|jgi:acyl-CoA thioesterase-2|nr:acyl-CoA thioesterase II [Rhizomicrobium sp.]
MSVSHPSPIVALLKLLDLEAIEVNVFRGVSPMDGSQRVFGGQVLAQALVAASRTVEGRVCHSLHAYFLLPGDPKIPILYEVDRSRDGRSFSSRRVVAIQHGRPIFHMAASFQIEEEGLEHEAPPPPDVPTPDDLPSEDAFRRQVADRVPEAFRDHFLRKRPIELRPVNRGDIFRPDVRPARQSVWVRATGALPDDLALHQCVLAYASDMTLLDTALLPHGIGWFSDDIQLASIDHAMWFHRRFRIDEWLLYVQDSPSASGARGFSRGLIYTRDGKLVASVAQEGLMRLRTNQGL